MDDLRKRFGRLVAAHRRRCNLTQEALADRAGVSANMISKIEAGASGARFPVIERLAKALAVDEAELFTAQFNGGALSRGLLGEITTRLAGRSESELQKVAEMIELLLKK